MNRFERQTILPGFGEEGQQKLAQARVLLIGAGGLGCPALLYLAAAGVGTIGIVDGDRVSVSNLNRQVLFGEGDVGKSKAELAAAYIREKYADIQLEVYNHFLSVENALDIIRGFDLVVDGSDNFPTRYLVNDACVLLNKPLVFGAIYQHEGQVAVLNAQKGTGEAANYRDLFPQPPASHEIPNCTETGVLGVLPGIIGTMQATEAIKYLADFGNCLIDKVLFYNLKTNGFYEMEIGINPEGRKAMPQSEAEFSETNYQLACGNPEVMEWEEAKQVYERNPASTLLLDVREQHEQPKLEAFPYQALPLSQLEEKAGEIQPVDTFLVFCQSGVRSLKATEKLQNIFPGKDIFSISGGINKLLQQS